MQSKATLNYLRIAPRKVRLAADLIRGKTPEKAEQILNFTTKRAAEPILKLLKQALANAENNLQLDPKNLFIAKLTVDEGPKLKRWRPRSRGQAYPIQKKTSHITLILDEIKETKRKKTKKKAAATAEATEKPAAAANEEKPGLAWEEKSAAEKPKFKPQLEVAKPKVEKGVKRIFRRKAI